MNTDRSLYSYEFRANVSFQTGQHPRRSKKGVASAYGDNEQEAVQKAFKGIYESNGVSEAHSNVSDISVRVFRRHFGNLYIPVEIRMPKHIPEGYVCAVFQCMLPGHSNYKVYFVPSGGTIHPNSQYTPPQDADEWQETIHVDGNIMLGFCGSENPDSWEGEGSRYYFDLPEGSVEVDHWGRSKPCEFVS